MNAEVLKEFLVKLVYQVDAGSEKKFQQGLKEATSAAVEMGKAVVALSVAVQAAAVKIGDSLDTLYFQSQRTQASAKSIREVGYAVSQLGGSYREALGSIEAFSAKMRQNPGYESMVRQLGVATRENGKLRETTAIMQDLGKVLSKKSYAQAYAYANALGVDENTFRAMMSGEWQKRVDETRKKMALMGVDVDGAAKSGNRFMDAWRGVQDTLGGIGDKLATNLLPNLTVFMQKVDTYLQKNSDQIVKAFTKLGEVVVELGNALATVIKHLEPIWAWFDKTSKSILGQNGLTTAIEVLIGLKVARWLNGIAAALGAVNAAAMGGGAGLIGKIIGLGRLGMVGAAGMLLGGAETPESYSKNEHAKRFEKEFNEKNPIRGPGVLQRGFSWIKEKLGFGSKDDGKPSAYRGKLTKEQAAEMVQGINKTAKDLGVSPNDIATAISYETGGTFDPWKKGPTTKWGQHRGLIQWGEPQRQKYGVSKDSSIGEQMEAVTRYLRDAGVRPGHGLLDIYSAINAGRVGRYNASDAGAGGAPGTVADKVNGQMGGHRKAFARLRAAAGEADGLRLPAMPKLSTAQSALLGSLNKGAVTAPAVPLAPSSNDNTLNFSQQTTINVTGTTDPSGVASAVERGQKSVNQGLMRNAQGALR